MDRLMTLGPLTRTDKNNLDKLRYTSSSTQNKEGYFDPASMNKTNQISIFRLQEYERDTLGNIKTP